jgi:type IV secretory pathway protease TraF
MKAILFLLRSAFWKSLLIVLCIAVAGISGGRFNRTASHPIGLYWRVNAEPAVGHYAEFCIPWAQADLPPMDRVFVIPCTSDNPGHMMLKRIVEINLDRDEYTVQGDHPLSVDSRIFGPINRAHITHVLVPVWTVASHSSHSGGSL